MSLRAEWQAKVRAAHGTVTHWPPKLAPARNAGQLAARYGASRFELAPLLVRIAEANAIGNEKGDAAAGRVFIPLENAGDKLREAGVTGVVAGALGIPKGAVLVILLVVLLLVLRNFRVI